ncbi:MAG: hypothetical protein ACR2MP_30960 [Streptosporangiaceae bacterium]
MAFGGPGLRTAYVTLAGTSWLAAMDWHEPEPALACGRLTRITPARRTPTPGPSLRYWMQR